jgi:hypothetical protein
MALERWVQKSMTRRFPPPRSVEKFEACFVVIDSDGQNLFRGMSPAGAPQPAFSDI